MTRQATPITTLDQSAQRSLFLQEVLEGLTQSPKTAPCKYFYDERGSRLFDDICELPEYYPTKTELGIMRRHIDDMTDAVGPRASLIEPGAGSGLKTRLLLDHLEDPAAYVPVEISGDYLEDVARQMDEAYPEIEILPVCADFTETFEIPETERDVERQVVYFPGTTIGNFTPPERRGLLRRFARLAGRSGGVLLGFDLQKDPEIHEAAYNDSAGVTREFNMNLLRRINKELGGDFDLEQFEHRAVYNHDLHRIEMHLFSKRDQEVHLAGRRIRFEKGESIHTESSHKFTVAQIQEDAQSAGLTLERTWMDAKRYFAVGWFTVDDGVGEADPAQKC